MSAYQLKPELLLQKVADEMVLLEPESGEYFTLNNVGADMLEQLQQGKSAQQIAQYIADIYDVTAEQAGQDFQVLMHDLVQANLAEAGVA
ncbi:MAG: PqqD family protein [Aestuariibacter sp.]|uniref:PqqD family protein n=1 Tax=Marisediminitalea aggregata TaxID=634436 RepID=UPI0020CB7F7F|nr:PqqD family protein [Marisediminitalea aggregata]MCP4236490.1 PqqD family protein [Aestuariibacter sp.]MCP9478512.1 PqqD family protein [Marisediminitalea aggregata]|tara:strand:+ start:228 stop:497 length:270 start_codon:yes stop_codon:yes gene_type:complete